MKCARKSENMMIDDRFRPASEATLKDLSEVRHSLLSLHALLLRLERAAYEGRFGKQSSGEMLKAVIGDEQFAWLHVLSRLVVRIDEMLDAEEPVTVSAATSVIDYSIEVLRPGVLESGFQEKYLAALQNEPDVIFAHREAQALVKRARANLR
jgi:hypothetical protein